MDTSIKNVDLTDRHVILKENVLNSAYADPTWRVVRATGGFGTSPTALGRAVFVEFVRDGEKARFNRECVERLATPEEVAAAEAARAPRAIGGYELRIPTPVLSGNELADLLDLAAAELRAVVGTGTFGQGQSLDADEDVTFTCRRY